MIPGKLYEFVVLNQHGSWPTEQAIAVGTVDSHACSIQTDVDLRDIRFYFPFKPYQCRLDYYVNLPFHVYYSSNSGNLVFHLKEAPKLSIKDRRRPRNQEYRRYPGGYTYFDHVSMFFSRPFASNPIIAFLNPRGSEDVKPLLLPLRGRPNVTFIDIDEEDNFKDLERLLRRFDMDIKKIFPIHIEYFEVYLQSIKDAEAARMGSPFPQSETRDTSIGNFFPQYDGPSNSFTAFDTSEESFCCTLEEGEDPREEEKEEEEEEEEEEEKKEDHDLIDLFNMPRTPGHYISAEDYSSIHQLKLSYSRSPIQEGILIYF